MSEEIKEDQPNIYLTEKEAKELVHIINIAVRSEGLAIAATASQLASKIAKVVKT